MKIIRGRRRSVIDSTAIADKKLRESRWPLRERQIEREMITVSLRPPSAPSRHCIVPHTPLTLLSPFFFFKTSNQCHAPSSCSSFLFISRDSLYLSACSYLLLPSGSRDLSILLSPSLAARSSFIVYRLSSRRFLTRARAHVHHSCMYTI